MVLERGFGFCVPDLPFLVRQVLPCEADDLGKSAMVRLDLGRDVLTLNERGAKEDESVGRTGDVVFWFLFAVGGATASWTIGGGEEDSFWLWNVDEGWGLVVCDRGDIRSERDTLVQRGRCRLCPRER